MMKPGDLARLTFSMPQVFESFFDDTILVMQPGDCVVLLKHESDCFGSPCWQVLCQGHTGLVSSKWLCPVTPEETERQLESD